MGMGDIVATAIGAGSFNPLVATVKAIGLLEPGKSFVWSKARFPPAAASVPGAAAGVAISPITWREMARVQPRGSTRSTDRRV